MGLGPGGTEWVSITVLIEQADPPRAPLLEQLLTALEHRMASAPAEVLADYLPRCSTIGQQVRARMIPMGPGGPEVSGEAVDVLSDGALVMLTAKGNRVAVPPQNLGMLEPPAPTLTVPTEVEDRLASP